MKKLFLFIGIVSLICSGCAKFSYDITIDNKDNITIKEIRGVNSPYIKSKALQNLLPKDLKNAVAKLQSDNAEEIIDIENNFVGISDSKKNISFSNVSKSLPQGFSNADAKGFTVSRGLVKRYYRIHLIYNIDKAMRSANNDFKNFKSQSDVYKLYGNTLNGVVTSVKEEVIPSTGNILYKITYANGNTMVSFEKPENVEIVPPYAEIIIKTPVKALKHNASKVINNKEYQWTITGENQSIEIILEYERVDLFILIMLISVLIAVVSAIVLNKKVSEGSPVQGL